MATLSPYLNFNGNCEEAFNFYKSVFGGEFPFVGRFKDMQAQAGGQPLSEEDGNKIMHMSLQAGDMVIMGSDAIGDWADKISVGNNVQLSLNAGSTDEADRWFNGLSAGGQVTMPLQNTFWGAYFGMLSDKFGINWLVNYDHPRQDEQKA